MSYVGTCILYIVLCVTPNANTDRALKCLTDLDHAAWQDQCVYLTVRQFRTKTGMLRSYSDANDGKQIVAV